MFLEVTFWWKAPTTILIVTLKRSLFCVDTSLVDDKIWLALVRLIAARFITFIFVHILMDLLMLFQVPRPLKWALAAILFAFVLLTVNFVHKFMLFLVRFKNEFFAAAFYWADELSCFYMRLHMNCEVWESSVSVQGCLLAFLKWTYLETAQSLDAMVKQDLAVLRHRIFVKVVWDVEIFRTLRILVIRTLLLIFFFMSLLKDP